MNLQQLIFGKKPPPVETLRQALADAEREEQEIAARLAGLMQRREEVLLNGMSGDTLDKLDEEMKQLGRLQDRNDLSIVKLKDRLEQTEQAERDAEAQAIHKEAAAAQERGLALIERYGTLAGGLVELLTELKQGDAMIRAANARLHARGDQRSVATAEGDHWKRHPERVSQFPPWSITANARLPHPTEPRRLCWPIEDN